MALDSEDFGAHAAEDGGLVAAAGAYLQDFHARGDIEQLALHGDGGGVGDGLLTAYLESAVLVGEGVEGTVEKPMALHLAHGVEHRFVGDTLFSHLGDKSLAQPFVFECVLSGH